jgi:hypothetical protein
VSLLLLVMLGGAGMGLMIYAGLETEPEDIRKRAIFGIMGLLMFIAAVMMV